VLVTEEISVCPFVRSLQLSLPDFRGPILFLKAHQASPPAIQLDQESISEDGPRLVTRCKLDTRRVFSLPLSEEQSLLPVKELMGHGATLIGAVAEPVRVLDGRAVGRLVVDMRRFAISPLRMPGQTLAWEDFELQKMPTGDAISGALLRNENINWIVGSTEKHLLHTWPLPYPRFEDPNELLFQANPNAG
jgi:hypothetical protein